MLADGAALAKSRRSTTRRSRLLPAGVIGDRRPVWTTMRGAVVEAFSPAKREPSVARRLDEGEHTRTQFV